MWDKVIIGAIVIIIGLIAGIVGKITYDHLVKRKNELHAKDVILTDNETVSEETLKEFFKDVPTFKNRFSSFYVNENNQVFKMEDSDEVDAELKDKLDRNKGIIIL